MTRTTLVRAIGETALSLGYAFRCKPQELMNESIIAYPVMWLCPPRAVAVHGRMAGWVRYRVTLHVMELARGGEERDEERERWCALERAALEVCRRLGDEKRVRAAALTDCAPAEFSLTTHGERSMCLKMDVDVRFGAVAVSG